MKKAPLFIFLLSFSAALFGAETLQQKPTATVPAVDDWMLLQGSTNGMRKIAPAYFAPANSPTLTGTPLAPTAAADTSTTQIATTAFSKAEADAAQAHAIQRANHTGSQAISTITSLQATLDAKASLTGTETLTNKRITRRVATPASATSITVNCDTTDVCKINALTHNVTFATPSGTPTEGQALTIETRASGGDRTVNFSSDFRIPSSSALTLPVTVTSGTKTKFVFTRDNDSSKWDFVAAVPGY